MTKLQAGLNEILWLDYRLDLTRHCGSRFLSAPKRPDRLRGPGFFQSNENSGPLLRRVSDPFFKL